MIIRDTDTETLQEARAILVEHQAHLGPNAQTQQALRIKIMAIDLTLRDRRGWPGGSPHPTELLEGAPAA